MANALDVTCQEGDDVLTAVRDETLLEKVEAFYWEGSLPMIAGMGGLIGLGVIIACCCCRSIRTYVSFFFFFPSSSLSLSYGHAVTHMADDSVLTFGTSYNVFINTAVGVQGY